MKSILTGLLLGLMVLGFQNCGEGAKTLAKERARVIVDPPDCLDLGNCTPPPETARETFLRMEYEELVPYEQVNGYTPTGFYGYDLTTGIADLTKFIPRHDQFIGFLEANNQTLNNTEKQQIRDDQVLIQFKHLMAHSFDFTVPGFRYATEYFFSFKIKFPAPSNRVIAFDNYNLNNLPINGSSQDFGYSVIQRADGSRSVVLEANAGGEVPGTGINKNFLVGEWNVSTSSSNSNYFGMTEIDNSIVINGNIISRQMLVSKVQKRTTEILNIYDLGLD